MTAYGPLPQITVAQLGARMHYAVPVLLHRAGMLGHFFTDAYVGPGSSCHLLGKMASLLPAAWRSQGLKKLLARRENGLPADKVTAFNLFGWRFARDLSQAADWEEKIKIWEASAQKFCQRILRQRSLQGKAVYAFQGAALPLFRKCRETGMMAILEQFIAPELIHYHLISEEHSRWPDWEAPYPGLDLFKSRFKVEKQEWMAADVIICASDFVAQGLASLGVPVNKIQMVPYGLDLSQFTHERQPWDGERPLRILFVGGVTLRKGPQYLYQALERLDSSRLEARLVGPVLLRKPYANLLRQHLELTGMVPRTEIYQHYEWADVFVFPSICEGSATVCYEALAAGLPVITTPNAGSVVRDGVDGFIVPIRDPEAIAAKLDLLARDRELLAWMSENARHRAREFTWEKYGERLTRCILEKFQQREAGFHASS